MIANAEPNLSASNSKVKRVRRSRHDARLDEIVHLWNTGLTTGQIESSIGIGRVVVRRRLIRLGIYHPRTPQKEKNFGVCLVSKANAIMAQDLRSEAIQVRKTDEANHWGNHPDCIRWHSCKRAKAKYKRNSTKPFWRFKRAMAMRVWKMLNGQKTLRTFSYIGCTVEHLRQHLESQFKAGMTWENYGTHWEVDHIRPCASFDLAKIEQQKICFNFSNLQPLEKSANRKKSSHWLGRHHKHQPN